MSSLAPCIIVFIVSLILFIGLFFGLNYPEIQRNNYSPALCTLMDKNLSSRYCCEKTSCTCTEALSQSKSCSAMVRDFNLYSPSACAANKTACPDTSQMCGDGFECCATCYQTCESCTNSCDSKGSCRTSCSSYLCNPYCCSSVSNERCMVTCPMCYNVDYQLRYTTMDNERVDSHVSTDYVKDVDAAQNALQRYNVNGTLPCWYNPADKTQVFLDVSYSWWKWFLTSLFGILGLAVSVGYFAFAGCRHAWKSWRASHLVKIETATESPLSMEQPSAPPMPLTAPPPAYNMITTKNTAEPLPRYTDY